MDNLLARCQALEEELQKRNQELEAANMEIDTANLKQLDTEAKYEEIVESLKLRLNEYIEKNAELTSDLEGSEGYARDARKKYKQLQAEYEESRHKLQQLQILSESLQSTTQEQNATILKVECRVKELEADRDSKAPLIKVALDIRSRYLEQAKAVDTETTWGKGQKDVIECGNKAAHNAMGHVDKLLFRDDYLDRGRRFKMAKIFKNLYKSSPEQYGSMSEKMLKAIDCEATIRTVTVLNNGLRPLNERQLAVDQINILQAKHDKMSRDDFEKDEDVDRRLAHLIQLTGKIVIADRQSKALGHENLARTGGQRNLGSSAGRGFRNASGSQY